MTISASDESEPLTSSALSTSLGELFSKLRATQLTSTIFCDSHGAFDGFLGCGYIYYGLAAAIRSQVSVCIGSGGGFVPEILKQAQRDHGIDTAATYLIDANLSDLGFGSPSQSGGWLDVNNDFTKRAGDVIILKMLSTDAAALFFNQGVLIDYLHIDGDHSKRGVIADFEDFAPVLSPGAIVSLHDTTMPSVTAAMDVIRLRNPEWEYFTLGEVGVGTAFMRRRTTVAPKRLAENRAAFSDTNRQVLFRKPEEVDEAIQASRRKSSFERWHYLSTAAYRIRYLIAADLIDEPGATVIEVGGFPNSVVDFLDKSRRVIAFDPYTPADYIERVSKTAAGKDMAFMFSSRPISQAIEEIDNIGAYNVVWLGLDISADIHSTQVYRAELKGMLQIMGNAKACVIELPQYVPSALTWKLVLDCLHPQILRDVKLDLSEDPVADEFFVRDGRSQRRVIVFNAKRPFSGEVHSGLIDQCASDLMDVRNKQAGTTADGANRLYRYWASELPARGGKIIDGLERFAEVGKESKGCLTFGPYLRLASGNYAFEIIYRSWGDMERTPDRWDVCVGVSNVIAAGDLPANDARLSTARGHFTLSSDHSLMPVEIRTHFAGAGDLCIRQIVIHQL
ncbi:hypothetical protein ASF70_02470 [Rhizobium sp. Leaf321]|uniref:class I SAM-dependent methyltransferase n=1 Tax=Rhizobium sp. Leaf321 TaxID=1736335 RepID=UPI00071422DC|nr:class I SAM-dependent methyltransferase [Rhizobium sp. Leaf321]KQQ78106.1 hypothetical protein ASF70_02470 [Rhizobium sp. Leaf321]